MSDTPAPEAPAAAPVRKSSGLLRNSLITSGFTLISKFSGGARDLVLAAYLGASGNPMADAYNTAQAFPNLFRRIFAEGAFAAAFVPSYSASLERDGQKAADKLAHDAMATLAFMTLVLTLVCELAMPWLMMVLKPGFAADPAKFKMAVLFTQITMPYLPCMAIVAHLSGVLNARGRFVVSSAVQMLLNLVTLAFILPQHTPYQSALWGSVGTLVAGGIQGAFLFWGVKKSGAHVGFSVIPVFTPDIRKLLMLAIPGALAAAATQVNIFISQNFSSAIPGATSWLTYADRFYQLPLGLVGVAIGTSLLPALSRAIHAQDHDRAQQTMDEAIVMSMAFSLPAAVALVSIPFFLVDGLYTRGSFHVYDSHQTAACILAYGWGVPAFVLTRILNPAFFARKDTFGPMKFAMVSVIVNLAVGLSLFHGYALADGTVIIPKLGAAGLAAGTSAASWINVAQMVFTLAKRKSWIIGGEAVGRLFKLLIASAGMAVFCIVANTMRPVLESAIGSVLPVVNGVHAIGLFGHKAIGTKEIAVLGVCFAGLFLYIGLLFVTGAVKAQDLKAVLRRRK